jgi:cyclophilin family peptidyl-prolyl cis-trans isomerase
VDQPQTDWSESNDFASVATMKRFARMALLFVLAIDALATYGRAGTLAQFRTTVGDIDVELFDQEKPATVRNFLRYVNSGAYTNFMFLHRWSPGFVIQGGGYYASNRFGVSPSVATIPTYGTITNEYSIGPTYSNAYGTIAMARVGGQTNSASSNWFLNLTNNAFLDSVDGGFTVFGRVVRGTNVLNRFLAYPSPGLSWWNAGGALTELPSTGTSLSYSTLIYVDVTLLQVSIQPGPNGSRTISWNSSSNQLNRVEYTTNFPPSWITLATTNGNGSRLTVTDTNIANPEAFYRVRVDY